MNQTGKQTGMVNVSMGDDEKFYLIRLINVHIPVPFLNLRVALVHAAIDGEPMTVRLDDVTRPGDGPGGTHEFYLHNIIPLA
jgi:hypothetical protein